MTTALASIRRHATAALLFGEALAFAAAIGALAGGLAIGFVEAAAYLNNVLLPAPVGSIARGGALAPLATVLAPTAAGLLCAVILRGRAPDGPADLILEAQRAGRRPAFWRGIRSVGASLAALGGGMSVGQYGPLAFLGGLVGGRLHHWSGGYRGAGMACGVAAAIAAAFSAPIAGVLFAHEAVLRHYSPRLLALVIIAAVAGHGVSDAFARPPFLPAGAMPANGFADITLALALGVLLGVYGGFFLRSIFALQRAAAAVPPFARPVLAGFLVGLIALFAPAVMGGGQIFLRALTGGAETPAAAAALLSPSQSSFWLLSLAGFAICKTAATALCLGLGAPGGVFSPTLLIGAAAGLLFGILCESFSGAPPWVFAVCGMIAMSAPAIGAPLSGILIVFELTRNYAATIDAAVAAAIACLICHRIAGGSYYEKQLRARGIEIDDSRERYLLSETKIAAIAEEAAPALDADDSATTARRALARANRSAMFVVDRARKPLGEVSLRACENRIDSGAADSPLREMLADESGGALPILRGEQTAADALALFQSRPAARALAVVDDDGVLRGEIGRDAFFEIAQKIARAKNDETR